MATRDLVVGATGVLTGVVIGALTPSVVRKLIRPKSIQTVPRYDISDDDDDDDDYDDDDNEAAESGEPHKLVLCVRTDLKMQKGKIAAQAGHATIGAYKAARRCQPESVRMWEAQAQPKIAVQISSRQQALSLQNDAKRLKLSTYIVYDAGRTQVAAVSAASLSFNIQ